MGLVILAEVGRAADQLDQISYDGGKQMRAGDQSRLAGQTQNLNKELSDQETENWTQVSVVIIKDDTGIENACDCLLYVYLLISKVLGVKNQVGVRVSTMLRFLYCIKNMTCSVLTPLLF